MTTLSPERLQAIREQNAQNYAIGSTGWVNHALIDELLDHISAQTQEIERYRMALAFYAETSHWEHLFPIAGMDVAKVRDDVGERARAALRGEAS